MFSPINIAWGIFGLIFLFILLREIVTWYWKINRIVELLENIDRNTRKKGQVEEQKNSLVHEIIHPEGDVKI